MSLTTVRRCGTVVGKELKNSEIGGTRIRKSCGFFMPARFTSGGRQPYNTRKGKTARRPISVLNLPTPTGAARKNVSLCSSHKSGDIFMSQSIIPFDFHSHVVRVVMRDGNPWFVAKDVMDALDYAATSNPARVTEHIPSEWKGVNPIHTLGGEQKLLCLAEPGLYFFLGRSDKPKALPFQKWLAGEVLPSIRKTGEYTVNPDLEYDQMRSYSKDRKQMEALNTAHSRWISDVRQVLESAGIKEPEFPKELEDSKAIATSALVELLRWHRWILDFGPDFRLRLTPVTLHTNVLTSDEVADWVRHPTFPSKHLPDIAKAAIERMSKAFSEKAIGPHLEQVAPKGMGNASRHLS
ncbi:Bro-N domain-containing protein [Xylella fastidiosa]